VEATFVTYHFYFALIVFPLLSFHALEVRYSGTGTVAPYNNVCLGARFGALFLFSLAEPITVLVWFGDLQAWNARDAGMLTTLGRGSQGPPWSPGRHPSQKLDKTQEIPKIQMMARSHCNVNHCNPFAHHIPSPSLLLLYASALAAMF